MTSDTQWAAYLNFIKVLADSGGPWLVFSFAVLIAATIVAALTSLLAIVRTLPRILPGVKGAISAWKSEPSAPKSKPDSVNIDAAADLYKELQLEAEVSLLQSVISGDDDAKIIIDTQGIVIAINKSFEHLTGYDFHEVNGCNCTIFMDGSHFKYHDSYLSTYLEERGEGRRRVVGNEREILWKLKSGELVPMRIRITEIRNGHKFFLGRLRKVD